MNERLKELRKTLGLTMEKFGAGVGVKKNTISQIESGVSNLTEQMINSICKTNWNGRYVNETWLRTGEGEMFRQTDLEEEMAALIASVADEPDGSFKRKLFTVMARLNEDQWKLLADLAEEFAKN